MTQLNATYSWPWANTLGYKQRPTCCSDWPWALLMVMLNAKQTGYCIQRNGACRSFESGGARGICGMKCCQPSCSPPRTRQLSVLLPMCLTCNCVPLHRPLLGSRFLTMANTWISTSYIQRQIRANTIYQWRCHYDHTKTGKHYQ